MHWVDSVDFIPVPKPQEIIGFKEIPSNTGNMEAVNEYYKSLIFLRIKRSWKVKAKCVEISPKINL